MNSTKDYTHRELLLQIKAVGNRLNLPTIIAKKFYYGYLVNEKDKPRIYKLLTGQSLDLTTE
ncbi:hypothetical protein [Treponema sp. UBA7567]|mgnify:CR=1 FL=1|uniref:hypothetical protein n=1 Tax=Treponema sp. UBA7567 TaxID=1947748 RepID=UPI0025DE8227|nr:hypothetical protein [Treponema sp. UBA7567]